MMSRLEKFAYVLSMLVFPILLGLIPLFFKDIPLSLGAIAGVLLAAISVTAYLVDTRTRAIEAVIDHRASIKPIDENGFYDEFINSVRSAKRRVHISYLYNKSPFSSQDKRKRQYYGEIEKIIKRKSRVNFKRLIRAVPETLPWIQRMTRELSGAANFSLSCILDESPEKEAIEAIAVQLIDNGVTYLVAVGEQKQTREPRDICIESEALNKLWSRYYERQLWEKAVPVIERGSVIEENLQRIEHHITEMKKQ